LILIDSYGWIEYFTDGPLAESYAPYIEKADVEKYVTPTIVIYEVCRKIKSLQGERNALEAFAQMSRTRIVELTSAISLRAADISIALKLGVVDAIILATAQECNAEIVTCDKHLKDLKKVKFINK
jgi:predicted nucleic acid-binding protein